MAETPTPWEDERFETEDSYGKYYSRQIIGADGRVVCDMQNSDAAEIHEDWSDADDGGSVCDRYDLTAVQNAALIVRAVNGHAALRAALESIAADAEEFSHGDQNAQSVVRGLAKIARRALEES